MEQLLSAITGSSSRSVSVYSKSVTGIIGGVGAGVGDGTKDCSDTSKPLVSVGNQNSNSNGNGVVGPIQSPQQQSSAASNGNNNNKIPFDILDDLASRFIINTPVDERNNLIRICFQIELAHWFYLDFYCFNEDLPNTKKLSQCGIKQFAIHLFHHIPFLRIHLSDIDKILEDWKEYKLSVPTYGAILVTEDLNNVLLVQSYWAKSSWGFPKGKINEHEDPAHCATREVYEETGFDITDLIEPKEYIEAVLNYQYTRLYLIRNVPYNTIFSPRTRKEIKSCEWFAIDALPASKSEGGQCKTQLGINANSFFMIMPFMKRLKKWVHDNRSGIEHKFSSSPITTINNNGSYTDPTIQTAFKTTTNINNNNNNNNNSSSSNNNNNNNSNAKMRPRHKSMGDIDGVNLNNLGSIVGIKTSTPKNEYYFNDNKSIPNSKRVASGNLLQNQNHIKRQLFNSSSIDIDSTIISTVTTPTTPTTTSTTAAATPTNNRNSSNSIINENEKKSSMKKNYQNNNDKRLRTKSLSGHNNLSGNNNHNSTNIQRKISHDSTVGNGQPTTSMNMGQQNSNNSNTSKQYTFTLTNSNITNITDNNGFNLKTKQLNCIKEQAKDYGILIHNANKQQEHHHQNSNNKLNPNFESWTNFSFTKNFITNVF